MRSAASLRRRLSNAPTTTQGVRCFSAFPLFTLNSMSCSTKDVGENSEPIPLFSARRRALEEFVIVGVETSIPLHQELIGDPHFLNGDYDIHWLESFVADKIA